MIGGMQQNRRCQETPALGNWRVDERRYEERKDATRERHEHHDDDSISADLDESVPDCMKRCRDKHQAGYFDAHITRLRFLNQRSRPLQIPRLDRLALVEGSAPMTAPPVLCVLW